jgi:hypothetical protein
MSPSDFKGKRESGTARIIGSGASGACRSDLQFAISHHLDSLADEQASPSCSSFTPLYVAPLLLSDLPAIFRRSRALAYPQDTVAKRLMSNRSHASASNLNTILFKNAANAPIHRKFLSLFPGLGYAAGYKVAQRVYKFGGQPYFRDLIDGNFGNSFEKTFGKKKGGMMMHALAGR